MSSVLTRLVATQTHGQLILADYELILADDDIGVYGVEQKDAGDKIRVDLSSILTRLAATLRLMVSGMDDDD